MYRLQALRSKKESSPEVREYVSAIFEGRADKVAELESVHKLRPAMIYQGDDSVQNVIDNKIRLALGTRNATSLMNICQSGVPLSVKARALLLNQYIQNLVIGQSDFDGFLQKIRYGSSTLQQLILQDLKNNPLKQKKEVAAALMFSLTRNNDNVIKLILSFYDPYTSPLVIFGAPAGQTFKEALYNLLVDGTLNAPSAITYAVKHLDDLKMHHSGATPFLALILNAGNVEVINAYILDKLQGQGCHFSYKEVAALKSSPLYAKLSPTSQQCIDTADRDNALAVRGYQFLCGQQDQSVVNYVEMMIDHYERMVQQGQTVSSPLFVTFLYISKLPFGIREQIISLAYAATDSLCRNIVNRADQMGTRPIPRSLEELMIARQLYNSKHSGSTAYMYPKVSLSSEFLLDEPEPRHKQYRISDR